MSNPYGPPSASDEPQPSPGAPAGPPDFPQRDYQSPDYQSPEYAQPPAAEDPYQPYAPVSYGQPSPGQPGYGQPVAYGQYGGPAPEHPQGTIVLILGILGFFVGVTAPFAWYLGTKAMKEIKATGATYSNEAQVNIGRILGIVMTLIYALMIVAFVVFFVVIFGVAATQS